MDTSLVKEAFDFGKICGAFDFDDPVKRIIPYGNGHINDTYLIECEGTEDRFVLQRINQNVFKKPLEVMENILLVTEHLRAKLKDADVDPEQKYPRAMLTRDGTPCFVDAGDNYWRVRRNIEDVFALDRVDSAEQMYYAGRAFGGFLHMLSDFDVTKLNETIVDFHNTPKRMADFKEAVKADPHGRCKEAQEEIAYILERERDCSVLFNMYEKGELPLRVTHNDTKINNVLFDNESKEGVCVIDLDTLMPGLLLYDFGDSMRSGANTADEDEPDTDKVHFDIERFRRYAQGYLEANTSITPNEKKMLAFSAKLLCLEQGIRFLGDYIVGDAYYKIFRPLHNLERARTQLKLVYEIESQMDEMNAIIEIM